MIALFSDDFGDSLKKHSTLKKIVQKKVDMVLANPVGFGEPLKGNLRGYYSVPVKKNFLIIYLYCLICRRRGDDGIVLCHDCSSCADETVKFVQLGPHDHVYDK
jgi:mRNA-degrading endonuclease YafQ of YafQ-DinJ toxin-antitoxin module